MTPTRNFRMENHQFWKLKTCIFQLVFGQVLPPGLIELTTFDIPTDRARKADEKNGAICLVTMLTAMSHGHENVRNSSSFYIFCWWQQKLRHGLDKTFNCILLALPENTVEFLDSELPLGRCQSFKIKAFCIFCRPSSFALYFFSQHFPNGNSKAY